MLYKPESLIFTSISLFLVSIMAVTYMGRYPFAVFGSQPMIARASYVDEGGGWRHVGKIMFAQVCVQNYYDEKVIELSQGLTLSANVSPEIIEDWKVHCK